MEYFNNIPFTNLEFWFAQVYKLVVNLPGYLMYLLFFWTDAFSSFWIKVILWLVSVFFAGIIFYSIYRIWEINQLEFAKYMALFVVENKEEAEKRIISQEWIDILGHLENPNPSNWVIAVIEADKILDMLLAEKGYPGANIGERLKSVGDGKLRTLQDAWEGHKIRNKIAHESGYNLEKREARKAISHYEMVFREFGYLD